MIRVEIHTDGGCKGNPGPGAWAFVLEQNGDVVERAGAEASTTNNRMELCAVIAALQEARKRDASKISVHTDSQYVQKGIEEWIHKWVRNGWKTASNRPVKNRDLWQSLHELDQLLHPAWIWVRGHAGNEGNERCHRLVQEAIADLEDGNPFS